ncbi:n-acetylglutamate synthase [Echinicola sp. CAU 1574]|uniref:N-acetylglutamate synthase n=1 Tax=Echinicola arenosa TaxID=2774144 RepID=A0ABR9AP11_9BACT|nr:n-acetylglutamate synthase [Echinicola arenosa]MBD8490528.1 n-acetylglutamate synthase [Echinicola arenosa]
MKINYNNKRFRSISNSGNGEVSSETFFEYKQEGTILTGTYSGGEIIKGQLLGKVNDQGVIAMNYHHLNTKGQLMSGCCKSVPEFLENGKIKLLESWQWTSGDGSVGQSVIEEI